MTTTTIAPTTATSFARTVGLLTIAAGVVGAAAGAYLAAVEPQVPATRFSYPLDAGAFTLAQVFFFFHHLPLVAALVALRRVGAVPAGRVASTAYVAALAGMAGLTVNELVAISTRTAATDSTLAMVIGSIYGLVSVAAGLGLIVLGVTMLRNGPWRGWRGGLVAVLGVYVFVPMTPALVVEGDVARIAIAGWMLLFALLGWALWRHES